MIRPTEIVSSFLVSPNIRFDGYMEINAADSININSSFIKIGGNSYDSSFITIGRDENDAYDGIVIQAQNTKPINIIAGTNLNIIVGFDFKISSSDGYIQSQADQLTIGGGYDVNFITENLMLNNQQLATQQWVIEQINNSK